MKVIKYPPRQEWDELLRRPAIETHLLSKTVGDILDDVRANGDAALRKYALEFDKVEIDQFLVSGSEFDEAEARVPQDLKDALAAAKANIEKFHAVEPQERRVMETSPGVFCWTKSL